MHSDSAPSAYAGFVWYLMPCITHAGVDHVRSLCSRCLDCLEDVHSSFNFDPLNFGHTSDKHTTAGHSITEKMGRMNNYALESCANVKYYKQNYSFL